MSDQDIAALKELCAKATREDLKLREYRTGSFQRWRQACDITAEFDAAARTALPALIAANERLETELAEARRHIEIHIEDWHLALDARDKAREQRDTLVGLLREADRHLTLAPLDHFRWCEGTDTCDCACRPWIDERKLIQAEIQSAIAALRPAGQEDADAAKEKP